MNKRFLIARDALVKPYKNEYFSWAIFVEGSDHRFDVYKNDKEWLICEALNIEDPIETGRELKHQ